MAIIGVIENGAGLDRVGVVVLNTQLCFRLDDFPSFLEVSQICLNDCPNFCFPLYAFILNQ